MVQGEDEDEQIDYFGEGAPEPVEVEEVPDTPTLPEAPTGEVESARVE